MASDDEANVAERQRWNDANWASVWPKREVMTGAVTEILLSHLDLRSGERVLDVGSGGGTTTIAAGDRVGPAGSVVGADISAPLVELARSRVADGNHERVVLRRRRAARDRARRAVRRCAQSVRRDVLRRAGDRVRQHPPASVAGRAARVRVLAADRAQSVVRRTGAGRYAIAPPPPAPGKSPTGPFSLSDPERVERDPCRCRLEGNRSQPLRADRDVERDAIIDDVSWRSSACPRIVRRGPARSRTLDR